MITSICSSFLLWIVLAFVYVYEYFKQVKDYKKPSKREITKTERMQVEYEKTT